MESASFEMEMVSDMFNRRVPPVHAVSRGTRS